MKRLFLMPLIVFSIALYLFSCNQSDKNNSTQITTLPKDTIEDTESVTTNETNNDNEEPVREIHKDTVTKVFNHELKVLTIITNYNELDIQIFRKTDNNWQLTQLEKDLDGQYVHTNNISMKDFNQDGIEDLRVTYGTGARGSNELAYVFLQKTNGKFELLNGSNDIPNIDFDEERKVITGIYYTGSITFIDFKIENNTLIELRGVNVESDDKWTYRNYFDYKNGKRINEKRDSIQDNGESTYSRNYK